MTSHVSLLLKLLNMGLQLLLEMLLAKISTQSHLLPTHLASHGGNWKYDEASISFNGKYWVANSVFTRSGDEKGWDTEIYKNS